MNQNNFNPKSIASGKDRMKRNMQRNKKRNTNKSDSQNKIVNTKIQRAEAPVSMGFRDEFSAPQMSVRGQNTIVRHREYVNDVLSSINFAVTSTYSINPGLVSSFPWLSQIAQRYEKYRIRKLRYTFETISPTTSVGSIMLVPDFDADDLAPTSKTQALSYKSSVRTQLWERIALDVKKEDLSALPQYYIRPGTVSNIDVKTYDVGNLFVCSSGAVASVIVGELWVEYEVELIAPTIQSYDAIVNPTGAVVLNSTFTGANNNQLFGDLSARVIKNNSIPITISPDGTYVTFNSYFKGILMILIQWTAAMTYGPSAFSVVTTGSISYAYDNQVVNNSVDVTMGDIFVTAQTASTFGLQNMSGGGFGTYPVLSKVYFMPFFDLPAP
jgi:hypothetical protein